MPFFFPPFFAYNVFRMQQCWLFNKLARFDDDLTSAPQSDAANVAPQSFAATQHRKSRTASAAPQMSANLHNNTLEICFLVQLAHFCALRSPSHLRRIHSSESYEF